MKSTPLAFLSLTVAMTVACGEAQAPARIWASWPAPLVIFIDG